MFVKWKKFRNPKSITFDLIAKAETRIRENVSVTEKLILSNYSFEHIFKESSAGGTLLCISSHLLHKIRGDLKTNKKIELKSTFIEKINPRKPNIIVCVIHRHPKNECVLLQQ